MNASRGALSVSYGVDYFAPAIYAVSAGEILRIGRLHRFCVYNDFPAFQCQIRNLFEEGELLLPKSSNYHIYIKRKFASRYGTE